MKALPNSVLFGALFAPFSAHAHPGHEGVVHALRHVLAGVDPVWAGILGGMAMIVGALYIGHTRT